MTTNVDRLEETGTDIHVILNQTLHRELSIAEYKELVKLIGALSQAGIARGRELAVEYINHNLMWGRDSKKNLVMDSKHLAEILESALTTGGK